MRAPTTSCGVGRRAGGSGYLLLEVLEPRVALSNYFVSLIGNDSAAGMASALFRGLPEVAKDRHLSQK
jgi:hypothetical protein